MWLYMHVLYAAKTTNLKFVVAYLTSLCQCFTTNNEYDTMFLLDTSVSNVLIYFKYYYCF